MRLLLTALRKLSAFEPSNSRQSRPLFSDQSRGRDEEVPEEGGGEDEEEEEEELTTLKLNIFLPFSFPVGPFHRLFFSRLE